MTHLPTVPQSKPQAQQTALALPSSPALEPTAKGLEIARKAVARMLPPGVSYVRDLPATAIVSAEKCHAILAALEPVQPPVKGDAANPNREHAAVVAACMLKLLGAWPERRISDQKAYRANLETLLWEYPATVCFQAIDELTRTAKHLPNRAELALALSEANETLLKLRRLARSHLEDGQRRALLAAQPRVTDEERAANKDRVSEILDGFFKRPFVPGFETHATPPRAAATGDSAHA